jgi:hypothetical protein
MDFQDRALDVLLAGINELSNAFKLCFAVSTGAVVLFIHVLSAIELPKGLLAVLCVSVLCFGSSSIHCIHSILGISRIEVGMAQVLVKNIENRGDVFLKNSGDAVGQLQGSAKRMEQLFNAGVLFATLFVFGFAILRK